MKKALFQAIVCLAMTAFMLVAQDPSKFNGTWKGDGGQVRKLTFKDGIVFMEETQTDGRLILRQYPTKGQEITMTEGVWKDSKATGKMEGNKLVVETTMPTGMQWHDEWTMAADGKTYAALRQMVSPGNGGGFGARKGPEPAAGAAAAAAPAPARAGSGRGANAGPETFTKVE